MRKSLKTSLAIIGLSMTSVSYSVAQTSEVVVPKLDTKVSRASFLRDKLTDQTVAYARVPSLFSMAFNVKNKASDKVMLNHVNEKLVLHLKKVLQDSSLVNEALREYISLPFNESPIDLGQLTTLVYTSVNGPIEIMATDVNKMMSPATHVLVSVPVSFSSPKELNRAIDKLTKEAIRLQSSDGFYEFSDNITMYLDDKEQRLFISVGMKALNQSQLKETIGSLKSTKNHRMYAYENQIDLTGQNLFVWGDLSGNRDMAIMLLQDQSPRAAEFLQNTEGFALGLGTNADHLGQAKFIAKTDAQKITYLKDFAKPLNFKTVGEPKNIAVLALPSKHTIVEVLKSNDAVTAEELREFELQSQELFSFNVLDIFDIFGPKMIAYDDDSGANFAMGLQKKDEFYQLIKHLESKKVATHKVEHGIHELKLENPLFDLMKQMDAQNDPIQQMFSEYAMAQPMLAELVSALYGVRAADKNFYLYWHEEGNWIVFNSLPYSLLERNKAHVSVDQWMDNQGIRSSGLIASYTGNVKHAEENWYRDYIKFMRNNHDVLGLKFDVYSMPKPAEMRFNPESRLGAHIAIDKEWLVVSLDYDISPFYTFSLLYGQSGLGALAVMGSLSAFALPAYQDYTKRVFVAEGIALSSAAKLSATEMYMTEGEWPMNNSEAGLLEGSYISSGAVDSVEISDAGEITISFNHKVGYGNYLTLKASPTMGGAVQWQCYDTNISVKYLPVSCRTDMGMY